MKIRTIVLKDGWQIEITVDKPYEIKDKKMNWFQQIFSITYYAQGIVYIENDEPTYCGSVVRWLDNVCVTTSSQKRADRLMFDFFHEKYPYYKQYIQLF